MSWSTTELRVRSAYPETCLSPPVKYFTDRSKVVLLLWIFVFFLSCGCYAFVRVCLYVPCGHLLGKGWPLGSRFWCLTVSVSLSHWYPGSGVVFDWMIPDCCTLPYFTRLSTGQAYKEKESLNLFLGISDLGWRFATIKMHLSPGNVGCCPF